MQWEMSQKIDGLTYIHNNIEYCTILNHPTTTSLDMAVLHCIGLK